MNDNTSQGTGVPPTQPQPAPGKDWLITLLLAIFVGSFGVDRFYTGHTLLGVLKLLTCGGLGIWWLIDVIMIAIGSYKDKDGNPLVRK